jgi:hypothetical protein
MTTNLGKLFIPCMSEEGSVSQKTIKPPLMNNEHRYLCLVDVLQIWVNHVNIYVSFIVLPYDILCFVIFCCVLLNFVVDVGKKWYQIQLEATENKVVMPSVTWESNFAEEQQKCHFPLVL